MFIYLFVFCIIIGLPYKGDTVKFYDLDAGQTVEIDDNNDPRIHLKEAMYSNSILPEMVVEHTKEFINREGDLRKLKDIAKDKNIVQYCFYGFYKNQDPRIYEESMSHPSKKCKGIFYLSGTATNTESKVKDSKNIRTDIIPDNDGLLNICRQRNQPNISSTEMTMTYLYRAAGYLNNQSEEVNNLISHAGYKLKQLQIFKDTQATIIKKLNDASENNLNISNTENDPLKKAIHTFTHTFLREITATIEAEDYEFQSFKNVRASKAIDSFIKDINKEVSRSGLEINTLLNSKQCNLGCSEQLLFYELSDSTRRNFLAQRILKALDREGLESVWLQIHSTKTPCRACLISCCGHIIENNGVIQLLFKELKTDLNTTHPNLSCYFVVSYETRYIDDKKYGFYLPVANNINQVTNQVLLIDNDNTPTFPLSY